MEDNLEQPTGNVGSKYGKFKDADSLFEAYNALQSDYTKKCQAVAEYKKLLADNEDNSPKDSTDKAVSGTLSAEEREELLAKYVLNNEKLRDKLIAKYFDDLILPNSPRLIASDRGSSAVVSPTNKPHSLEEAERVVRGILENNKK